MGMVETLQPGMALLGCSILLSFANVPVMKSTSMYKLTVLITMLLLLQACSSLSSAFRASPAPDSGFIDTPDQMTEWRERLPLDKVWIYDREDFHKLRERFTKIHFALVTTNFLLKSGWWNSLNQVDKEDYRKDVSEMAKYIKEAFERAFKDDPKHRFTVVQEPDHETIIGVVQSRVTFRAVSLDEISNHSFEFAIASV